MPLPAHVLTRINSALAREPVWKRVLLETSVDAFREWLRRVLPEQDVRILESLEDEYRRIVG
jgi:hypothetical protein